MLVCCIGTNFSPAKYKGTFDGVDISVTVNAEERPEITTVLEAGPSFNARIQNATTITFGMPSNYPQFEWDLTEPKGIPVDENYSGGIQLFNDSAGNYYVLSEGTIATGIDCSNMFKNCSALTNIYGLEKIDTTNATTMEYMFSGAELITSLDLHNFNTGNVTKLTGMFSNCKKLEEVDLSGFNTINVTSFQSMFYICHSLKSVDLSSFDAENVTTMAHMFYACHAMEIIDLSSFSTPKLKNIMAMFGDCKKLKTVYVSEMWTIANLDNTGTSVFEGAVNIVGGQGTVYDGTVVNGTRAIPDEAVGGGAKGYFTLSEYLYKIYYHTFDEEGNDYVWRVQGLHSDDDVPAYSQPREHKELTFIGWSAQCHWIDPDTLEEPANIDEKYDTWERFEPMPVVFGKGENITVSELIIDNSVHLYDLYEEYKLTIKGSNLTSETEVNLRFAFANSKAEVEEVVQNNWSDKWYFGIYGKACEVRVKTDKTERYFIAQSILTNSFVHYIHPGSYVSLRGNKIDTTAKVHCTNVKLDTKQVITLNKESSDNVIYTWQFGLQDSVAVVTYSSYTPTSSSCFAAGTLITMADGSKLPIEEVEQGDMVRVYDHENGCYTASPVLFTEYDGDKEYLVTNLEFSDGTTQKFIYDHGLFDLDLNKYVYITPNNCEEFIGHRFAKERGSGYKTVTLEKAWAEVEYTGSVSGRPD